MYTARFLADRYGEKGDLYPGEVDPPANLDVGHEIEMTFEGGAQAIGTIDVVEDNMDGDPIVVWVIVPLPDKSAGA